MIGKKDRSGLKYRFAKKHTWHDGVARIVTLKKREFGFDGQGCAAAFVR